ncbi:DnaJ domain-containing protein [Dioszegia hungarica]|uniref:DnaJ domain-containing protein n=1 Tax=Dioszegia hungarica TaxID=4972 RepID=A0AA38LSP0_9TREE|nr:DnaJ domain-containing protein [Dioszegia hungarica]KAI9635982.1 DnaJ domain-containing protein [Dioszegia hungarica]
MIGVQSRGGRALELLNHAGPSTRRHIASSARRSAKVVNHYEALKLPKNATKQQVKARFYELSKKYHPDTAGGDISRFHSINDAYATLGDDSKRKQYDQSQSQPSSGYGNNPYAYGSSPLRPQAQGPHRSWGRAAPRRTTGPATSGAHYSPFGRRTPEYGAASGSSAYARTGTDPFGRPVFSRRKGPAVERDDEEKGESGLWRFGVVVGLLLAVVGFGGGLTASADTGQRHRERPPKER